MEELHRSDQTRLAAAVFCCQLSFLYRISQTPSITAIFHFLLPANAEGTQGPVTALEQRKATPTLGKTRSLRGSPHTTQFMR